MIAVSWEDERSPVPRSESRMQIGTTYRRPTMAYEVRFTRHAQAKFSILADHGFFVSEEQVRQTVLSPDRVEDWHAEQIAQKKMSDTHVLRVVYRVEDDDIVVITFYPGRRRRYEDQV